MSHAMIGSSLGPGNAVDKRRTNPRADDHCRVTSKTIFTANAAGTTTTLVGANAAPGVADTNVVRRDEKFRLFTAAGVLKEETVFRITAIAVAASTTVTFTPAAAVATVSTDVAKRVTLDDYMDTESMDRRLFEINSTSYSLARLATMTVMDKRYALDIHADGGKL